MKTARRANNHRNTKNLDYLRDRTLSELPCQAIYCDGNMVTIYDKSRNCEKKIGRPLISIYILGHLLPQVREKVVYVKRTYLNHLKQEILQKDEFIESLCHDTIIVQIPLLKGKMATKLERILSVFNQRIANAESKNHKLDYEYNMMSEEQQKEIEPLVRCLQSMASNDEIQEIMSQEDYYLAEMEMNSEALAKKDKLLEIQGVQLQVQSEQLEIQGEQLQAKDEMIAALKKQLDVLTKKNGK